MDKETHHPFITVDQVTIRLGRRFILPNSSWQIKYGEHWAVLGPNGSGKSTLVRALWGGVPLRSGRVVYHFAAQENHNQLIPQRDAIGYVSFETHQRLMEHEALQEDLREYAGKKDETTTAKDVILSGVSAHQMVTPTIESKVHSVANLMGIQSLLPRGVTSLSTGEIRKTLIARALLKSPRMLILDEPFDGLDDTSRASLFTSINHLLTGSMQVILVTHRLEEIVPNITHILFLKESRLFMQGKKEEVLTSETISALYGCNLLFEKKDGRYFVSFGIDKKDQMETVSVPGDVLHDVPERLIEMKDTTVKYDDHVVLDHFNWSMRRGENWAILGPNGSGKSTILKLILGDNVQGYANQLFLFGKEKGSGETLWEIKRHIGVVSSELQVQYRKKMRAWDVIASGFYDSIGIYQYPTPGQEVIVKTWVELFSIGDIVKEAYHELSYGQKRMILLARSMVKSPALLILDEPCHGLDILNRRRILNIIERIGKTRTNLLYVTNHKDEILDCITHVLRLKRGKVLSQGRKEEILIGPMNKQNARKVSQAVLSQGEM